MNESNCRKVQRGVLARRAIEAATLTATLSFFAAGCATGETVIGDGPGNVLVEAGVPPGAGGAPSAGGFSGLPATGGLVGAGGRAATGGAGGSGGAAGGSGGTASGNGGAGTAAGGSGAAGAGNGAGGRAQSGGAPGAGGAPACPDSDADGVNDCVEDGDGDTWTDSHVFNGMHVSHDNQCSASGNCGENDTLAKVDSCMAGTPAEEKDQYSGWDWDDAPNQLCDDEYDFQPPWDECDASWAAKWAGCIHLTTSGPHCFAIEGGTDEGCAALYFNGNSGSADAQSDSGVKCFSVAAGNYPILWHYTMDDGSSTGMHVRYCDAAGGATCTPSAAIPASMLRTSCP